jgi:GDP-mannose 6-dehydrogenase
VAETIKYVDNVWHATKVCFANEVGRLCKPLGVDIHAVMDIFTQDQKLNLSPYYLRPGFAYGGSCLPKEVRAVSHIAESLGVNLPLIANLDRSLRAQIDQAVQMVRATGAKRVGVLGLAFKPGTDDLRESPILEGMTALKSDGVDMLVHDSAVTADTPFEALADYMRNGSAGLPELVQGLRPMLRDQVSDVLDAVDAVIVCHANDTYRAAISHHPDLPVIDVVRLYPDAQPATAQVNGIGW